jgi:hypothetical protein
MPTFHIGYTSYYMANSQPAPMTTKKALLVVGTLIVVVGLSAVVPAKWFGVQPAKSHRPVLVLRNSEELAALARDSDRNNNPDWKDLLIKKRLADPNNLTASFSKNLYTVSAYAKKNGKLTKADQKAVMKDLIASETSKIVVKTYEVADITTTTTDTPATERDYGNALGKLFKKAVGYKLYEIDLNILKAYTTNKDPAPLASLVIKKNNAKIILEELLKMRVPFSAVPYHLLIINRLSQYITVLDGVSQADTDPLRATVSFNSYLPTIKVLSSSLDQMKLYFSLQGIVFTSNEAGYVLTSGYTTK